MDLTFFTEEEIKQRRIVFQTLMAITVVLSVILIISYARIERFDLIPFVAGPILLPAIISLLALQKWSVDIIAPIFIYFLFSVMIFERLFCSWNYLVDFLYVPSLITISFFSLKGKQKWIASLYLMFGLFVSSAIVYLWEPFKVLYTNELIMNSIWISAFFTIFFSLLIHGVYYFQFRKYTKKITETTLEQRHLQEQWSLLLSSVIHDFNNSITILHMNIQAQSEKTPDSKFMESAKGSLNRIQKMISNLKVMRSSFSVSQKIAYDNVDLCEILSTLPLLFQESIKRKELNIDIQTPTNQDCKINANPITLVHHILANILSNAVKFCPIKGKIKINLSKDNSKYVISILNPVESIDPKQKKIFEQLLVASTKGSLGELGHGLGLFLVRKFCLEEGYEFSIQFEDDKNLDAEKQIVIAKIIIPEHELENHK